MTSYVFMGIFVSSCPISNYFYQSHLPHLQEELKKLANLETHMEIITQATDLLSKDYPHDLVNYLRWSPIFFLIPKPSWDRCCKDKGRKLKVKVFNGSFIEGHQSSIKPLNPENIVGWILDTME